MGRPGGLGLEPGSLSTHSLQDKLGPSSGVGGCPRRRPCRGQQGHLAGRARSCWGLWAKPGFRVSSAMTQKGAKSDHRSALQPSTALGRMSEGLLGGGQPFLGVLPILQNSCRKNRNGSGDSQGAWRAYERPWVPVSRRSGCQSLCWGICGSGGGGTLQTQAPASTFLYHTPAGKRDLHTPPVTKAEMASSEGQAGGLRGGSQRWSKVPGLTVCARLWLDGGPGPGVAGW